MRYGYNTRKVYKQNYGDIPVDDNGLSYHIHHIDGNHNNDDPSNLVALTVQEHYDIHYNQKDYGACKMLASSIKNDSKLISELVRQNNIKLASEGRHPSQTEKFRKEQSERCRNTSLRLSSEGKLWTQSIEGRDYSSKRMKRLYDEGNHPTQKPEYKEKMSIINDERFSKTYIVTKPGGDVEIIRNLKKYCRDHSLTQSNMVAVSKGRQKHHKGYTVKTIESVNDV